MGRTLVGLSLLLALRVDAGNLKQSVGGDTCFQQRGKRLIFNNFACPSGSNPSSQIIVESNRKSASTSTTSTPQLPSKKIQSLTGTCQALPDTNFHGHDLPGAPAATGSFAVCTSLCLNTPGCTHFTRFKRKCYLKNSAEGGSFKEAAVSATCYPAKTKPNNTGAGAGAAAENDNVAMPPPCPENSSSANVQPCTNGANGAACQNGGQAAFQADRCGCGCNCAAGYAGHNCEEELGCGQIAVASKPHIIFVLADDLGFNDVGYNHKPHAGLGGALVPITPKLDELAHAGVIFDRLYTFTKCAPSRASMLTGRVPVHVSQRNPSVAMRGGGIPLEMITIGEKLKGRGYTSWLIGKWHAGSDLQSRVPVQRGFSHSFGMLGGTSDYYKQSKSLSSGYEAIDCWRDNGPAYGEAGRKYGTHLYTDEAVAVITAQPAQNPLFVLLSHQAPHAPLQVPQKYIAMYAKKTAFSHTPKDRQIYLGMVTALDEGVESVVSALVQQRLWNNTLLVFASDNGGDTLFGSDNYPLRGAKSSTYEGGVRTAGFISGGIVPSCASGRRLSGMLHIADFMATFGTLAGYSTEDKRAEIAGLPPSDSVDFWQYAMGTKETSGRQEVSIKGGSGATLIMSINGIIYKYIRGCDKQKAECVLYDLSDPSETSNLKDENPTIFDRMKRQADALDATEYQAFPGNTRIVDLAAIEAATSTYHGHWGPWVV